jgi:RNA polymerase sigma factor (sigma-70 family)
MDINPMNINEYLTKFTEDNFLNTCKKLSGPAGGHHNAEDIFQEAMVRTLKYYNTFRGDCYEDFTHWVNKIISRAMKDFINKESLQGMSVGDSLDELSDTTEDSQSFTQSKSLVSAAILKKKGLTKEVLTLNLLQGYAPRDICEILDCKNKTVRMILFRFKKSMEAAYVEGTDG